MGLEHMLAGFIASWLIEKKNRKNKDTSNSSKYTRSKHDVSKIRHFLCSKKSIINDRYIPVNTEWFEDTDLAPQGMCFGIFEEATLSKLKVYYEKINAEPASFQHRLSVIDYIYKLWREDCDFSVCELLQNELLFLIDNYVPTNKHEVMYVHLAMFLSSQCYIISGEFSKAIDRLYQALNWQAVYCCLEEYEFDRNGLVPFIEASIVNMINLFSWLGLTNKTNEVRSVFAAFINERNNDNRELIAKCSSDPAVVKYANMLINAAQVREGLKGLYFFSANDNNASIFDCACSSTDGNDDRYFFYFDFLGVDDFTVVEQPPLTGDQNEYPCFRIRGIGSIFRYKECLKQQKEYIELSE